MSKTMFGYQKYTVVSAVYNVSAYLEDYFTSITNQQFDFQNNIYLVMVDDGSTDDSAQIIKDWQKRFPENIIYIYQENGGVSSARNVGIEYVKTDWVTFIDPDDFLDLDYFLEVDIFFKKNQERTLHLLSCNMIFYHEDKKQFADTHSLKYRFSKGDVLLPYNDLNKHIQLTVNSVFFKTELLIQKQLQFDSKIRPNFEDGHFVGIYLANLTNGEVGFSNKAKYFYRKRSAGTSLIDTSWRHKGRYSSVLLYGYIELLERYYTDCGLIPKHIQRTVLYDLIWYLKTLVNKPEVAAFLNSSDRNTFVNYFERALTFIEPETIVSFELVGCWFFHKVGLIEGFKQEKLPFQIVYIEDYDPIKSQIQLRYFTSEVGFEKFALDGEDVLPHFAKTMHHDFLERTFVRERRIWLPLSQINQNQTLKVQIGEYDARITLGGKQHKDGLKVEEIKKHFKSKEIKHEIEPRFAGSWLFMDRDTQADDNAEHLYRYVQANYPEQNIFFVLRDSSHDWARLEKLGFNLLAYGSAEHESALRSCAKIISSHADVYVVNYFKDYSLDDKQFIFLQHGVIKDDLSSWLNSKKRIDCFITSALPEFKSISSDESRYKYTKKEVNLTGLPRHDALINSTVATEKLIVVMPTWRNNLLGKVISGSVREVNQDFIESEYAQAWLGFLKNSKLAELSKQRGYRVVYFPHSNVQPYLAEIVLPDYIEVLNHQSCSIQDLFLRSAFMITDYSSVAFEMAFLQKPTLYYQFDEELFFREGDAIKKGYFDYRENGFGPVVTQEAELIDALTHLLEQDAKPALVYQTRMAEFFAFRDGRNCERVYEAVLALDQPMPDDFIDIEILKNAADSAYSAEKLDIAQSRLGQYIRLTEVQNKSAFSTRDVKMKNMVHVSNGITIKYRQKARKYDCNHVIFVFSGFLNSKPGSYDFSNALNENPAEVIWIGDDFNDMYTYYMCINMNFNIEEAVIAFIMDKLKELNLSLDDATFTGFSKGGSAALYYGLKYNVKNIVVTVPQFHIGSYVKKNWPTVAAHMMGNVTINSVNYLNRALPKVLHEDQKLNKNIYLLTSPVDIQFEPEIKPYLDDFKKYQNFNLFLSHSVFVREHNQVTAHHTPLLLGIYNTLASGAAPSFEKVHLYGTQPLPPQNPSYEPYLELKKARLEGDLFFPEGIAILRGLDCEEWVDISHQIIFKGIHNVHEKKLAKAHRPALTRTLFNGEFVIYDKGWFATNKYAGMNIADLPKDRYQLFIELNVKSLVKKEKLIALEKFNSKSSATHNYSLEVVNQNVFLIVD